MRAITKTKLPASYEVVWSLLKKSSTLVFVTGKWVTFSNAELFPQEWEVGVPVETLVSPFGRQPGSPYTFTFEHIIENFHVIRTRGSGGLVKEWIHIMHVVPLESSGSCYYIDDVEVKAGLLTPLLWIFVKFYYRYRHKRWLELLK